MWTAECEMECGNDACAQFSSVQFSLVLIFCGCESGLGMAGKTLKMNDFHLSCVCTVVYTQHGKPDSQRFMIWDVNCSL